MSNPAFYNRTGHVEFIEGDRKFDDFRGLNFKFSCEFEDVFRSGRQCIANVGILGLSGDRVHRWSTFCNHTDQKTYAELTDKAEKFVSVYAGYEGQGFSETEPIFTLPIVGAYPTSPPEMWLNISAYSGVTREYKYYNAVMENREKPIPFKTYCSFVAKLIGARLRWDYPQDMELYLPKSVGWGLSGTRESIIKYLNDQANPMAIVALGYDNQDFKTPVLFVRRYFFGGVDSPFNWQIAHEQKMKRAIEDDFKKRGPLISAETGMIGLPKVTIGDGRAGQIEVQSLLRKDVDIGENFTVKSEYIEYANATFTCTKIKHVGEFRGQDWYTTLTGIPSDLYKR